MSAGLHDTHEWDVKTIDGSPRWNTARYMPSAHSIDAFYKLTNGEVGYAECRAHFEKIRGRPVGARGA